MGGRHQREKQEQDGIHFHFGNLPLDSTRCPSDDCQRPH
jgi:hypothetical protein